MSVVAPILHELCVLLDVLQLSVALLISRHHLLLWLISHLSVLLAQAEFLFVFLFVFLMFVMSLLRFLFVTHQDCSFLSDLWLYGPLFGYIYKECLEVC